MWLQDYLLADQIGDYLYQCFDAVSLGMVLWMLHRVLSVQRELTPIKNFECCAVLGKGAFGKVFIFRDLGQQAGATSLVQVIMSVHKAVNLCGLMALYNEIVALRLVSSQQWAHPYITKLYDAHHSATHVCLRMQCGGMQDLYHRLMTRESVGHGDRSLSCRKVVFVFIISQCVSAVAHLHVGPQIAHRDIKPANVILSETADDATILLSDFGVARICTR